MLHGVGQGLLHHAVGGDLGVREQVARLARAAQLDVQAGGLADLVQELRERRHARLR